MSCPAELVPTPPPVLHKCTSCKNIQQLSIYASKKETQAAGWWWQPGLEQMKGLLFQYWRKGRWKSWQCGQLWMKVVYTNSREDKCLWEVSIAWCKQINHNKLGPQTNNRHCWDSISLHIYFPLPPQVLFHWIMSETKPPLREPSQILSEQKETSFTNSHLHLLCNSLHALLWLFNFPFFRSQNSSSTDFREREWLFFPLYFFPNQKNRTTE